MCFSVAWSFDTPENPLESKPSILLIEDKAFTAPDLKSRLQGLGYRVRGRATSGDQALEMIEQVQPDLVMVGIQARESRDGIGAAEEIRGKWGIPAVFLSAQADKDRLHGNMTVPFFHVPLPFRDETLQATVEAALYVAKAAAPFSKNSFCHL
ncbi:MAG: response regulator [Proteobacteria bacterium]|nr:response regulator [Pseudomonadota bacterium]